jgi:hypothetical protein
MTQKSKKRSETKIQIDLQEQIKRVRDHLTPFQNETSSIKQSWFDELVEWYAKVLFPNLREVGERVETVRLGFWMVDDGLMSTDNAYRSLAKRALHLFKQLEERHALLDQNREIFEGFRSISHDLSDSIEVINSDLELLARDLRSQLTANKRKIGV